MNYSYAMGINESIKELENEGFIIEQDDEDYMVSFPVGKEKIWEEFIIKNLSNGYWNEYIGESVVFIFKFNDGSTKKYILKKENESEILKLCCCFAETEFNSTSEMILGNHFYKEKVGEIKIDNS